MRSSARGAELGGSSTVCSQPTGGEPGGEIRKFFSIAGGWRWNGDLEELDDSDIMGVGSARNTRSVASGLSHEGQKGEKRV